MQTKITKRKLISILSLSLLLIIIVVFNSNSPNTLDVQREEDLHQIADVIYKFAREHNGMLPDTDNIDSLSNFPNSPLCIGKADFCYNFADAGTSNSKDMIIPNYMGEMPMDPEIGTEENSNYFIHKNAAGKIVLTANIGTKNEIVVVQ